MEPQRIKLNQESKLGFLDIDNSIQTSIIEKLSKQENDILKQILQFRLIQHNFYFENESDLLTFIKNRVTKFHETIDKFHYYLDFDEKTKSGILLFSYTIDILFNKDNFSYNINMSIQ